MTHENRATEDCWDCPKCGTLWTKHYNPTNPEVFVGYLAPHSECIAPNTCEGGHPDCSIGFDLDEFIEAVVGADGQATIALLRAHADHAFFNEPRNAVQILGCRGILVAHIPLGSRQLEALRQAIE